MAEKIRLTDARVRDLILPIGKTQVDIWDSDLQGFGLRIGAKSKTFFVMSRVNGRVVRPKVGRFPKIGSTAARSRAREMLVEMEKGINPTDKKKAVKAEQVREKLAKLDTTDTLTALFESMLAAKKKLSPVTIYDYRNKFKHLASIASEKVGSITRQHVITLHQTIETKSGPYAANGVMRVLSSIIEYSRKHIGKPDKNPVQALTDNDAWCEESPREKTLELINVPAFIAAAEKLGGCNGADLYRLLLFTGMRKSEGMRLQWEHVDLTADTLLIPKTKNGTPLELPLSVQVKNILLSRWNIWNRPSTGPVFPSRSKTGHTVQDGYIAGKVKMFIPGFSAHWLRSAFTTAAVSAKIDGMVIDRITNHAAKGITARHYYKPTVGDLREPMQKIADKIEEHALCCRLHPDLKHVV